VTPEIRRVRPQSRKDRRRQRRLGRQLR
jgi:hypothetical protein